MSLELGLHNQRLIGDLLVATRDNKMAQSVEDLCQAMQITYVQLVEKAGLEETRVQAILLQRWTPSPAERQKIAAVFGVTPDDIVWGHATPIQHLYGSGPG